MNEAQRVAFVHAQAIAAQSELAAMMAANTECIRNNEPFKYSEAAIRDIQNRFMISHNDVISYLMEYGD